MNGQLDFISPSAPKSNTVKRYHNINKKGLMFELPKFSFSTTPSRTVSALYEQYTRDLSGLLDKYAPTVL